MHILIKPIKEALPFYINHSNYHEGDAGLDVFTLEDVTVPAKTMAKVDTGIACEALNDEKTLGLSFYMYPRSSIVKTPLRLANSVGIIDRDYRGHLMGCFDNITDEDYIIKKGTRLLQICGPNLEPITFELVEKLSETSRGFGGFGSTGK
jgi:dUTP pyrophosphatase